MTILLKYYRDQRDLVIAFRHFFRGISFVSDFFFNTAVMIVFAAGTTRDRKQSHCNMQLIRKEQEVYSVLNTKEVHVFQKKTLFPCIAINFFINIQISIEV